MEPIEVYEFANWAGDSDPENSHNIETLRTLRESLERARAEFDHMKKKAEAKEAEQGSGDYLLSIQKMIEGS